MYDFVGPITIFGATVIDSTTRFGMYCSYSDWDTPCCKWLMRHKNYYCNCSPFATYPFHPCLNQRKDQNRKKADVTWLRKKGTYSVKCYPSGRTWLIKRVGIPTLPLPLLSKFRRWMSNNLALLSFPGKRRLKNYRKREWRGPIFSTSYKTFQMENELILYHTGGPILVLEQQALQEEDYLQAGEEGITLASCCELWEIGKEIKIWENDYKSQKYIYFIQFQKSYPYIWTRCRLIVGQKNSKNGWKWAHPPSSEWSRDIASSYVWLFHWVCSAKHGGTTFLSFFDFNQTAYLQFQTAMLEYAQYIFLTRNEDLYCHVWWNPKKSETNSSAVRRTRQSATHPTTVSQGEGPGNSWPQLSYHPTVYHQTLLYMSYIYFKSLFTLTIRYGLQSEWCTPTMAKNWSRSFWVFRWGMYPSRICLAGSKLNG